MKVRNIFNNSKKYDFTNKSTQHINAVNLLKAYLSCKKKVIKRLIKSLILINLETIANSEAPPTQKRTVS